MRNIGKNNFEEIYQYIKLPIWIYARKMYNGNKSFYELNDVLIQGQKKKLEHRFYLHGKTYNKVPREVSWWAMTKKGISKKFINIVQLCKISIEK